MVGAALVCGGLVLPEPVSAQLRPDSVLQVRRRVLAKKPVIRQVEVSGTTVFSADDIRSHLHSKQSSKFDALPFVSSRKLRRDSDRLDSLSLLHWLATEGHLNARVDVDYRFLDTLQKMARVSVFVNEGPRTFLRLVEIHATDSLPGIDYERHRKRLVPGEPFNPFVLRQVQYDLKEAYANLGYPYADLITDSLTTPDATQLDLLLECRAGPLVHFGDVGLPDLRWTKAYAVRRELKFKPGDTYSRRQIMLSEDRLYNSGLFDFVALEADPSSPIDTVPAFQIRCQERKPLFVNAGTGLKQDLNYNIIWGTQLEVGDRNFLGTGRQIKGSAAADFAVGYNDVLLRELKYRFAAAYTEPWPLGFPLPFTAEVAFEPNVEDPIRQYEIRRWEASGTLEKRWSRKVRAWLGFKYEKVDIFSDALTIDDKFRADSGLSTTHSLLLGLFRDRRDAPLAPTRGSLSNALLEYAGGFLGGDNDFIRVQGSWARYYRKASSWNIFAHRLLVGYLKGTGSPASVPTQELYFLGGANTVRGFAENSIGPRNEFGTPVGGEFAVVGNVELRRPLWGRFWMSLFTDVGNLWATAEDFQWDEWNVGAGLGVQFISPIGPIRLDYGRRVARVDAGPGGQLHVSIGYAF